ncbi:hypothetical protein ACFO9E_18845 [Streptomyces maoxianensis]|uniref:Uncharacterized protein n=1 Tax=Streptomyces maoxianensis TaxID=1459942 RepID=A0ABV9G721_9ACTN
MVSQTGGFKEHNQVVVGARQAQNFVPAASVHARSPAAALRRR